MYQAPPKAASERGIANKSTSTSVTGRGTSGTSNVIWWIIAAIGLAIILYFALRR